MFDQFRNVAQCLDLFVVVKVGQDTNDHLFVLHIDRTWQRIFDTCIDMSPGKMDLLKLDTTIIVLKVPGFLGGRVKEVNHFLDKFQIFGVFDTDSDAFLTKLFVIKQILVDFIFEHTEIALA